MNLKREEKSNFDWLIENQFFFATFYDKNGNVTQSFDYKIERTLN
jgi:hypothetical protein